MSGKLASQATVTKNGAVLRVLPDGEFDPGGIKRTPVVGPNGEVLGYTEETVAASYKGKGMLAASEKLSDFAFEDATVVVATNTGQKWIMRNAFTTETPKWGASKGEVVVEISCCAKPEEL